MDKLSIYEILSFVVPGFVAIEITNLYSVHVFGAAALFTTDNIGDSLKLFCASLFLGVVIHVLTFKLFFRWEWYVNKVFPKTQEIKYTGFTRQIIPFLNKEYERIKQHGTDKKFDENVPAENLFDFAYFYLEANDKIASAKNFQSIYFWFRNLFTICLILLPVSTVILIYTAVATFDSVSVKNAALMIGITLIAMFVIVPVARWLRIKMVDRVFGGYYAERIHQNLKK